MPELNAARLNKLRNAVDWSLKQLSVFREKRNDALKQYVGKHYSDEGAPDRVPINMLEGAVSIFTRHLMARLPQVLITARYPQLKGYGKMLELGTNHLSVEIGLEDTFRRCIKDGLFGPGICKIALSRTGTVEIEGGLYDVNQPFADRVSLDDFIIDMSAKDQQHVQYIGNRYRLPREYAFECGLYDTDVLAGMPVEEQITFDETGTERAQAMSYSTGPSAVDFLDYIDLIDLYLPRYGLFVTLPDTRSAWAKPAREEFWEGPSSGPYRLLGFDEVPDNLLPKPPTTVWMDLHWAANLLMNKLIRQAKRQKFNPTFQGGDVDDAERLNEVGDGEWAQINNPGGVKEIRRGGIDQSNFAFTLQLKELFDEYAGNLSLLGGNSPASETYSQDALLMQNASKRVQEMQDRAVGFMTGVMRDLAWYLMYDPLIDLPLTYRVPGTQLDVPLRLTPEARRGDFLDYNFRIDPYSTQHQPPGQRLQTLMQILQTIVLPGLPVLQQQGIMPNFARILKIIGQYTNMPELDDVLIYAGPAAQMAAAEQTPGPVGTPPIKAPVTQRNYHRFNHPARTQRGATASKIQALLGKNLQPAEAQQAWGGAA